MTLTLELRSWSSNEKPPLVLTEAVPSPTLKMQILMYLQQDHNEACV